MDKKCFNCGVSLKTLPKQQRTKDHIPPKGFFIGYPDSFKTNRITVDCCETCNGKFSSIDEEFRNAIAFANDLTQGNVEMTKKAVRTLLKAGKITKEMDGSASIQISRTDIDIFLKRCFMAIYYETYGEVFPENDFDIAIIADRDYDRIPAGLQIQQFITHEQSWSISGNPDVFKYAIKRIAFDSGDEMIVAPDINSSELVGIIMIFNEVEAGVVLAKRKQAKI